MEKPIKSKTLSQLKKAQGMLNKVVNMIEADSYCIDTLQQSLATLGFIKSANKMILENHLNCCFKSGMKSNSEATQKKLIKEVLHIVNKV